MFSKRLDGKSCFRVMAVAIMAVLTGAGSALAFSGSGFGTEGDPYVITDVYQLQEMQDDLDAYYVLGNDINASNTVTWNNGAGFEPVGPCAGDNTSPFKGTLDGKGYLIDGLYINRINSNNQGLFGVLCGAAVKSVILTNAKVTGDYYIGTLAGQAAYESVITRCWATGSVALKPGSGDSKSGGLIGVVYGGTRIDQCASGVNVNAGKRRQVGGLVGYLQGRAKGLVEGLSDSYSPVAVLTNSYAYGTVTGTGAKQGNLLGDADASRIDKCYSCAKGKALIGFNWKRPVITNCYWDKDKGASSSSYGGAGKTTAQMIQQATFVDWDFDEFWAIDEGQTYPYFNWDLPD